MRNTGLIAEDQRVENYGIFRYRTSVRYSNEPEPTYIAKKLQKTLDEEYNSDQKLNKKKRFTRLIP